MDSFAQGEVVPMTTFTASEPVPPKTILLLAPTRAFLPIAVMFVRAEVLATASLLDA